MTRTRRVVVIVLLVFAAYAIINSPVQSAQVVNSAFDQIMDGIRAIGRFFDVLLRA